MRKFLSQSESVRVINYMSEHFGLDKSYFEDKIMFKTKRTIWLTSEQFKDYIEDNQEIESIGIRAFTGRLEQAGPLKPTTYFAQILGTKLNKNIVELNTQEVSSYLKRESIKRSFMAQRGYVMVSFHGHVLGCAFYDGEYELTSHYPKKLVQYIDPKTVY